MPLHKNLGWLFPSTKELLQEVVRPEHRWIVEFGFVPGAINAASGRPGPAGDDHRHRSLAGSPEHFTDPKSIPVLPVLFETFWPIAGPTVIGWPVRKLTVEGLEEVARCGLAPDLIYVDANHAYDAVKADLEAAKRLFRGGASGDDWDWDGVRQAVSEFAQRRSLRLQTHGVAWRLL